MKSVDYLLEEVDSDVGPYCRDGKSFLAYVAIRVCAKALDRICTCAEALTDTYRSK